MKRYIYILVCILGFVPIWAQQSAYYYYYKGERIYLTVDSTRLHVVSEGELQPQNFAYARTGNYSINNAVKSHTYNHVVPLQGKRSAVPEVYFSTLEMPKGLTTIEYDNLIKKIKTEDNVWQVLPSFTIDGHSVNVTNNFYVKLKSADDLGVLQQLAAKYKIEVIGNNKLMPLWYTLSCNRESTVNPIDAANTFNTTGLFAYSEPETSSTITHHSIDPYYEMQWNLKNTGELFSGIPGIDINVEEAWEITKGDDIVVAVYDEPIYTSHSELSPNILHTQSYDIVTGGLSVFDPNSSYSHGTACASIIAAVQDNNVGLTGIAPESKIMPITFSQKNVTPEQLASGFTEACDRGADIISCSWSYLTGRFEVINDGIKYAIDNGCIIVFASGNDENGGDYSYDENDNLYIPDSTFGDAISYPADSDPRILTVGGITPRGRRTLKGELEHGRIVLWSSNYDENLDVVAPSVEIYTANYPNSHTVSNTYYYGNFNGTSAACPHVAGVAALVWSAHPELTADQVIDIIEYSCKKVRSDLYTYQNNTTRTNGTWNEEMGYGLVDAGAAVRIADKASRTTYIRDMVIDVERVVDYDIEIENVVVIDGGLLDIDKERSVFLKRNVRVEKGGTMFIHKDYMP